MNKMFNFLLYILVFLSMTSCATAKGLFSTDYSVSFEDTLEQVQKKTEEMENKKSYQKSFSAKDKMGNWHKVIIYDDKYLKIDNVYYAYKYRNLMYYGLSLNVLGNIKTVDGTDKVCGIQGYATAINNPDTTISFIFAKDLYPMKGYSSMYEANQINGVYFAGLNRDNGYIDDFGCWQSYTWSDYYEKIFNTMNKDVKMKMFIGVNMAK